MSTLNKSLLKSYVLFEQKPGDIDENYPSFWAFVLGVVHLFCGLFSIALGIGSICTTASGYYIGYGIWCGFLFLLSGVAVMITGFSRCAKTWTVMTSLVFGILAIAASVVQFSIGIVAASNDHGNLQVGRLTSAVTTNIPRYDVFYIKQGVSSYCSGSEFKWTTAWGPVDILLIIVAFIEAVVAITTAVFGCRSMCCGRVAMPQQNPPDLMENPYSPGFYNGGFN